MSHPFSCRPDIEAQMTPEQGERYQRIIERQATYWDTGDGFGGKWFRDFDTESDHWIDLDHFCCDCDPNCHGGSVILRPAPLNVF